MSDVLEKTYDPKSVEPEMIRKWEAGRAFQARPDNRPPDKRFVVMIPLPNVTGTLHLGHAMNNTLQDIVTRRHRMMGFNSLYQPGTDHAGIATQAVVERRIFTEEHKTRHDLGREELVRRIWEWKAQYESTILGQLKRMGCSCDWDRVRFTLDDRYSDSVHEMFFRWFQAGLIYRGERLVNWDTELRTAVADDEVYHETVKGHFWHFKYPLKDPPAGGPTHLGFATTRPETMLGDVALAVNPTDDRYKALVGKIALIPLFDPPREIPIIADEWADPEKGTGCVKITPAHDANDYAVGIRHHLPMINVMTADRCVSDVGGQYKGMKFPDARQAVAADMESLGLLDAVEDLDVELPHSDRSKSPIEPYLSPQWFVKMGDIPSEMGDIPSELDDIPSEMNDIPSEMNDIPSEPRTSVRADVPPPQTPTRTPDLSQGAVLVTWTTYGTWLPGDERGFVSRVPDPDGGHVVHNAPGEDYDANDAQLRNEARERMAGDPLRLESDHARVLLATLAQSADRHAIELLAIAIMPDHVHVLCQTDRDGGEILKLFKGGASRVLNSRFQRASAPRWFTRGGSTRFIKRGTDLTAAIEYVQHQKHLLVAWSFDVDSGAGAEIVGEARESGRSDGRTSARTEVRGSRGVVLGDGSVVSGLAQAAMDAVTDGRVRVTPERYSKTYLDWLSEKRDWCISRQLWWGHRIPVWSKEADDTRAADRIASEIEGSLGTQTRFALRTEETPKGERFVTVCLAREDESAVSTLESAGFVQDPDVLDTWFSSQLWPYATLGWPEKTDDLECYYPGTVLITSRDIITLWVARMVLSGLYNCGQVPFRDVYIHPKILDGRGETMSKSKGNGVDPLDVIAMYGADAMRYSLTDMTTETQDVRMPVEYRCPHCAALTKQTAQNMHAKTIGCKGCTKEFATRWADDATVEAHGRAQIVSDKFEIGRNFCNKLWNAARFAFMNLEGIGCETLDVASLPTEDRWILAKLSETVRRVHEDLDRYRFSASIRRVRDFFWDALCDWYIELTKARMRDGGRGLEAKQVLAFCMDQVLRLLHPFTPFVTERLWGQLNTVAPQRGLPGLAEPAMSDLLITAEFPPREGWVALDNETIVATFETLQSVTRAVRELRQRNNVPPKQQVTATINAPADEVASLRDQGTIVQRLANVGELHIATDAMRPQNSGTVVLDAMQVFVHDITDDAAEGTRLEKELGEVEKQIAAKEKKLANDGFVRNARPQVVQAERERLATLKERSTTLQQSLAMLR